MNPYSSTPEASVGRKSSPWRVLNRVLIIFIILVVSAGSGVLFIPLLQQKQASDLRIEELQARISKERHLLARYTREVELLKTDPDYIELVARDMLDLMKPGEVILRMEPAANGSPATITPITAP